MMLSALDHDHMAKEYHYKRLTVKYIFAGKRPYVIPTHTYMPALCDLLQHDLCDGYARYNI